MRKAATGMLEQGFKCHPLLQTSSPLNINRELTLGLVQQTGARQGLAFQWEPAKMRRKAGAA